MADHSSHPLHCILLGEQSLMIECGRRLLAAGHRIVGVVADATRLRDWAVEQGLPLFDDEAALLREGPAGFDLLLNITRLKMLPAELISRPRIAAINFHDGPLPRYAGLNAPAWALLAGETEHGVSWHRIGGRVDAGEVFEQERFAIPANSTAFELNARCFDAGLASFERLLPRLAAGPLAGMEQDLSQRSYFGANRRPRAAALLDFSRPAGELQRQVRALDFGPYANPLLLPRLRLIERDLLVRAAHVVDAQAAAGQVIAVSNDALDIACAEDALRIESLCDAKGRPVALLDLGLQPGQSLPLLSDPLVISDLAALDAAVRAAAEYEPTAISVLTRVEGFELPFASAGVTHSTAPVELEAKGVDAAAALLLAVLRCCRLEQLPLAIATDEKPGSERVIEPLWPALLIPDWNAPLCGWARQLQQAIEQAQTAGGILSDLRARQPSLRCSDSPASLPLRIEPVDSIDSLPEHCAAPLCLYLDAEGRTALHARSIDLPRLRHVFEALWAHARRDPGRAIGELDLVDAAERARLLALACGETVSASPNSPRKASSVQALIAAQAARSPEREALAFEGERLSYAELMQRADALAQRLAGAGLKPGGRVGLLLQRSTNLVVGLLAVLRAGAAYVPLDPLYPRERLAFMAEDAQLDLLLHDAASSHLLEHPHKFDIAADGPIESLPDLSGDAGALAYLIYTSGSTGQPKGVQVLQSNLLAFFDGMDAVLGFDPDAANAEPPGSWLAVTSISFDISVLELLWTLARGYRVVLYADPRRQGGSNTTAQTMQLGLFFWNVAEESELGAPDKYRLLLESARFADSHGFSAVWTPERHFAAFGGLFPNPAVTSAALATITRNIALRAGSCVVPLHHPARIAEEWAVVDNLSGGRVGLSIAAGWAAPDFVLRPENHAEAKKKMFEAADQVRRLWRGETLQFDGPNGPVPVRTLPRPLQAELPLWVTTAGNPDSFVEAGRLGANLLTHLLGQSVDEVAHKIALYRRARREAGHAGRGTVSLMLHSCIGESRAQVEALVRGPMKAYLRSAMFLVKAAAWQFPTFKKMSEQQGASLDAFFAQASEDDMDALLEFAFERYFNDSGLFGSPQDGLAMLERVAGADVNEIACLIDFGLDADSVLAHLPGLDALRVLAEQRGLRAAGAGAEYSVAALLEREHITHLQCTPSMAAMLVEDPACAAGLGKLKQLLLGGEALPPTLAARLQQLGIANLSNVYGPTETTVWSAADTVDVDASASTTPIGRPLRGQRLYVLDPRLQLLPEGLSGELVIGGAGVSAGYWQRDDLNAERFPTDAFEPAQDARLYRTGDAGRLRESGRFECLGRLDNQVKIRGYRVELGEIEARLAAQPGVQEAAVLLREDRPGDQRLVAYLRAPGLDSTAIDAALAAANAGLPEFMRPSVAVPMVELPRTPNGKLDRRALPAPAPPDAAGRAGRGNGGDTTASAGNTIAAMQSPRRQDHSIAESRNGVDPNRRGNGHTASSPNADTEALVVQLWSQALGRQNIGRRDNFFDLGGHSLLVVQLLAELRQRFALPIQMTDLFRHTTVESLARFLATRTGAVADGGESLTEPKSDDPLARARSRAQARKVLLTNRRGSIPSD
jgi:natural product biosynthesis luciferase-like monooxygenase protein